MHKRKTCGVCLTLFLRYGTKFLRIGECSWFLVPHSWFLVPRHSFLVPGSSLLIPCSSFLEEFSEECSSFLNGHFWQNGTPNGYFFRTDCPEGIRPPFGLLCGGTVTVPPPFGRPRVHPGDRAARVGDASRVVSAPLRDPREKWTPRPATVGTVAW